MKKLSGIYRNHQGELYTNNKFCHFEKVVNRMIFDSCNHMIELQLFKSTIN